MGKNKNKIRVSFVGENAEEVTGSCVLIETSNKTILVECGLYQGESSLLEQYQINNKRFRFKVKNIDYLIVCHSHIDHVGLIPKLYKQGATCKIISPTGLRQLFEIMGKDSAFILEKEAETLTIKFNREYNPIYSPQDVEQALNHWQEIERNKVIDIDENIQIRFVNSAHIINACQCELWIKNNGRTSKIAITSDLGNISVDNYYVENFEPIEKANLLIGEATYAREKGHITNKHRIKDLEKIKTIIEQTCVENKAKILFPIFALQRSQNILTYLYDLFGEDENFKIPIILDSPLLLKINEVFKKELKGKAKEKFERVLSWENIKISKEFSETEQWVKGKESCIFLSCSGMMTAGRSVYVASKLLPDPNNCIIFCGYANENSLANKIKNQKTKTLTIEGKSIPCRCQVANLLSFSSHMQRKDLLKYYSSGNYDKIAIVHSNFKDKVEFCEELQEEIQKKNKTNKVICINKSVEILL